MWATSPNHTGTHSTMFYAFARNALFALDPEVAHNVALHSLKKLHKLNLSRLIGTRLSAPREVMGLTFGNPVGLAAGLDKNGEYIDALAALGFGFIEVGTVTPRAQPGNPKPRMFRLTDQEALINRLGFNNEGLASFLANAACTGLAKNIQTWPPLPDRERSSDAGTPVSWHIFKKAQASAPQLFLSKSTATNQQVSSCRRG